MAQPNFRIALCLSAFLTGAATLSLLSGCQSGGGGSGDNWLAPLLKSVMPATPSQVARDVFNPYDPDRRRESVSLLSGAVFGGEEPYVRTYRLLVDDEDASVRAAAIKALGEHGQPSDIPLIMRRVDDPQSFVRWEIALALQKIHDPQAVAPLIRLATQDEDADVRMAAARALGQYPEQRVFAALVGVLDDPDYGVVVAARISLITLTGYDFGADGSLWLIYARQNEQAIYAHQQQYVWYPFVKPRGFWDKLFFWKPYNPPGPRIPRGLGLIAAASPETPTPAAPATTPRKP